MIKIREGYYLGRTTHSKFLMHICQQGTQWTREYSDEFDKELSPKITEDMWGILNMRKSVYLTGDKEVAFRFMKLMGWLNVWEY